jgi:hypothetical protein
MPTWLKIVLISLGAFILVIAAVVGGGYWWWQQNGDALIAEVRSAEAEGTRFATSKDDQACADEAVTRVKGAGLTVAVKAQSFLTACLRAARPIPKFCDGVPAPDGSTTSPVEIAKSASWNAQHRAAYGLNPFEAAFVMGTIQRFCASATSSL